MTRRLSAIAIPMAVLLLAGGGCGQRVAEQAVESRINGQLGDRGRADLKEGQMELKGPNGNQINVGENVSLPPNFPTDAPPYPGANILSAGTTGERNDATMSLTTTDSPETVMAWYEARLSGWKREADLNYGGQLTRQYGKDGVRINIVATKGGETTSVIVVRTTEPQ